MKFLRLLLVLIPLTLILSCKDKMPDFEIEEFNPISNWSEKEGAYYKINIDFTDAIDSGFVIPTIRQTADGMFHYRFKIRNNAADVNEYYYKIYYQNETYKFIEFEKTITHLTENIRSEHNFYGSWSDVNKGFVSTGFIPSDNAFHSITGTFSIVGNPRSEKKYFGTHLEDDPVSDEDIERKIAAIRNSVEWLNNIKKKAQENKISVDKQLRFDAIYIIKSERKNVVFNQRWKRNPRVGTYKFLLVVSKKENIENANIPNYIQNIGLLKGDHFVNPFYYFLYGPGKDLKGSVSKVAQTELKVSAKTKPGNGIYINPLQSPKNNSSFGTNCNYSYKTYRNAHFQQFFHNINGAELFNNIPLIADVSGGEYSLDDYQKNINKFEDHEKIKKSISNSCCPCKTVESDSLNDKIVIRNPGNVNNEYAKENVGIISRHGFTYGKFRVKAKLASLLNQSHLWNGLTNAIWLIYQSGEPWNERYESKSGYIPKNLSGKDAQRVSKTNYSEIDFEILKTSRFWPATSYLKGSVIPKENHVLDRDKIMITCTNWDLACRDAENFGIGVKSISYNERKFDIHRWDDWYQALTSKFAIKESELFDSAYYYFEIEWKPTEIIWRVGPEKNKMEVVGYMNSEVTNIPDNQMLLIVTQEYHLSHWWPGAPFSQDYIPFPSKDIKGEILEYEIE